MAIPVVFWASAPKLGVSKFLEICAEEYPASALTSMFSKPSDLINDLYGVPVDQLSRDPVTYLPQFRLAGHELQHNFMADLRQYNRYVWADAILKECSGNKGLAYRKKYVFVDDVLNKYEADYMRGKGALVVSLFRPPFTNEITNHFQIHFTKYAEAKPLLFKFLDDYQKENE